MCLVPVQRRSSFLNAHKKGLFSVYCGFYSLVGFYSDLWRFETFDWTSWHYHSRRGAQHILSSVRIEDLQQQQPPLTELT